MTPSGPKRKHDRDTPAVPTERDSEEKTPRLSRMEAAVDVPRTDDDQTTSSTHTPPLERQNEEPSDGRTAQPLEGAT